MSITIIEATKNSPRVELNPDGKLIIKGRSILENTTEFYTPVIQWVKNLTCEQITVEVRLEYMNSSSSKHLITILKNIAAQSGTRKACVKWFYEEDDEDMLDLGKDFQTLIHIPFDFHEYTIDMV